MNKKSEFQLIEGSKYRIFSIGGRDTTFETEGVFKGFATFGIDEGGIVIELSDKHEGMQGKTRVIPLPAVLAIDILDEKPELKEEDEKEPSPYYG